MDYKLDKENRHNKVEKRRQRMKVHGAGIRRIPQMWREKAEELKKKSAAID